MIGPVRDLDDPGFLAWPNLRALVSVGLAAGIVSAIRDVIWHGWSGVRVLVMVAHAIWLPLVLVGLHLHGRRARRRRRT